MKIIALEEHFVIPEVLRAWDALPPEFQDLAQKSASEGNGGRRLHDFGEERLAQMAEAGVDVQVLSLTAPGVQNLDASNAVALQTLSNDALADAIRRHPDHMQGFATLATPAPKAAAWELERAVTKLGFGGAMLHGRTRDRNLDHPDFMPVFEAADHLRAPLYIHPQSPQPVVRDAYYNGFGEELDSLFARPGIGWHYETGVQIIRLMLAGVFDRFPNLQIIAGHWGEVILFYLDRIDLLGHAAKLPRLPSEYFRDHVMVTPSGIFSQLYLRWAIEVIGIDRIMFAADYPYAIADGGAARRFIEETDLSEQDRSKIAFGNWERLCAQIRR
jgi:predicted TIM-barrel fold metal-dependent hydrolase